MTLEPIHSGGVWWLGNDSGDLIFPVSCKQQGEAFCELFNEETRKPLIAAAPDMLAALEAITSNPHINLGDLVYQVRERECQGWEGDAVRQWSEAVTSVLEAIRKAKGKA